MILFCPICKTTHDLAYSEVEESQVIDGRKFDFIKSSVKCSVTNLSKTDIRLKHPEEQSQLAYATARELVKKLPDGLKEKMVKEINIDLGLSKQEKV